jgi:hypothetical protein
LQPLTLTLIRIFNDNKKHNDEFTLGAKRMPIEQGRKQLQAKMALQLLQTDKACAERVLAVWKTMLSTTLERKSDTFTSLEEYLDFRIVDTGAP